MKPSAAFLDTLELAAQHSAQVEICVVNGPNASKHWNASAPSRTAV